MKKICHICVSLLVLSLFISCETPTSSATSKATAASSTAGSPTPAASSETIITARETTTGSTDGTVATATETTESLLNKVKGQTYFGIRTWSEEEAGQLIDANDPEPDEVCDELADRRLALVFNADGTKAGFADEDDQASAKDKANKSNQDYSVTVDDSSKKITLTKDSEKLVLGVHQDGKFLYILEDNTQKPQEVTKAKLDYKFTGLAQGGQENSKEKIPSSDWCPVSPTIPDCPDEFKKS